MTHLEFVDKLNKLGVHIGSTNAVDKIREYEIYGLFDTKVIIAENFKLSWKEKNYTSESPIKELLKKAVDMDTWKHSWHIEMIPENYEKIEGIIQDKILKRASEIDELLCIYFQLHSEMS